MSSDDLRKEYVGLQNSHLTAVFRVDSSSVIGSGHVMRCLTLAEQIEQRGGRCLFVCRPALGDLIEEIRRKGYAALPLNADESAITVLDESSVDHADWLVGGWQRDVNETLQALSDLSFDWLVIDHYGIDHQWESEFSAARPTVKLACIDDLADRRHASTLLIDQNLGRVERDYASLVPPLCKVLVGTKYALLRPEFRTKRAMSLARRREGHRPRRIFVNFGGVDLSNVTARVIGALSELPETDGMKVDVVLGSSAPHAESVQRAADQSKLDISVHINSTRVADLMTLADVAVGAGGGTSWERCSLGLPSMVVELAPNQRDVVTQLAQYDVAYLLDEQSLTATIHEAWAKFQDPKRLLTMSENAAKLVTGEGAVLVGDALMEG